MSTIDPSAIDPTKPETGEATTASVRQNEAATQAQLQNAKNDIEALEPHPPRTDNPHGVTAAQAGADPAGTAAGAVATHDIDPFAHFGTFDPAGTATATVAAHDADSGAHAALVAEVGTIREIREDGSQISDGDKILNFTGAGVSASSASGTTTVNIPGGGAGGGNTTSPGTHADDVLTAFDGANSQTLKATAITPADVARLSVQNTFAQNVEIDKASGDAALVITAQAGEAEFGLFPLQGSSNDQAFGYTAVNGVFQLRALADNGSFVRTIQQTNHAGGTQFGAPTGGVPATLGHLNAVKLLQQGAAVVTGPGPTIAGHLAAYADISGASLADSAIPALSVLRGDKGATIGEFGYLRTPTELTGASVSPTFANNGMYYVTHTGDLTIVIEAGTDTGTFVLHIPSTVNAITISGTLDDTINSPGPLGMRIFACQRFASGRTVGYWNTP